MCIVSIIVPIYNSSDYLVKCITSIVKQSYKDIEIILINDGSKDQSGQICDSIATLDSRIVVIHKENGGVSSARNRGLEIASGDWITFVDSDDYIDSDFVANMIALSNYDFVASHIKAEGWKEWKDIPLEDKAWERNYLGAFLQDNLNRLNFMVCKLFKKSIIDDICLRFDETISYGEDTLFVYQYLKHINSAATISRASYHYNCFNNSSLSKKVVPWDDIDYTINKVCRAIDELDSQFTCDNRYARNIIVNNYLSSYIQSLSQSSSFKNIYISLKKVSRNTYCLMLMKDNSVWTKSRKRLIFDSLMQKQLYFICSVMLYFSRFVS